MNSAGWTWAYLKTRPPASVRWKGTALIGAGLTKPHPWAAQEQWLLEQESIWDRKKAGAG